MKHGIQEPLFGVKIGDMKKIQKRIKKDYQLVLDLYDTGIYDAMYLAGLIADDVKMTKKDLQHWVKKANGGALARHCPLGCGRASTGRKSLWSGSSPRRKMWPLPAGQR